MTIIWRILFRALCLLLMGIVFDGIVVDGVYPALIVACVLSVLNLTLRPVLIILTLPITILTLGLFAFVVDASVFLFVASWVDGFEVDGFWYAILGSLLMGIASSISRQWFHRIPEEIEPE